jgi:hypothetical protein
MSIELPKIHIPSSFGNKGSIVGSFNTMKRDKNTHTYIQLRRNWMRCSSNRGWWWRVVGGATERNEGKTNLCCCSCAPDTRTAADVRQKNRDRLRKNWEAEDTSEAVSHHILPNDLSTHNRRWKMRIKVCWWMHRSNHFDTTTPALSESREMRWWRSRHICQSYIDWS